MQSSKLQTFSTMAKPVLSVQITDMLRIYNLTQFMTYWNREHCHLAGSLGLLRGTRSDHIRCRDLRPIVLA